ncbi:MAG: hypothetical protein ACLU41_00850 [Anaerotignum lactatifermentans]
MSAFYDNNVTDVGRLLLGDVQMGASFVPTKIVIGKGYLPQGKTTRTMTDVADVVKELALNKATKNPDGDAIFGAIFSNADIQEAFYYRELGLYAKGVYYNQSGGVERETAEVLYSYGNAGENAELIPAYSTGSVVERQLDLLVYIGNDTEVKLEIETGLYVTIPVFNDTVERLEKDIEEVRYIIDSTTAKKYEWAMESGTLSLDEVDGDTKINIADKETLDAVKGKVDLIHTNTEGLSGKIGQTNDSGGSEAAGSVFAKLNKIIGDIAAHVKQWTAERAAKLDQLDTINENAQTASTKATELVEDVAELKAAVAQETTVEGISNKIGAEGDADTQPTLFGRLAQLKNVLVEKLTELLTKVTGIDGKIGTSGDSEDSGTIFGTLKKILIRVYDTAILVPSDNVKTTLYSTQIDTSGKVLLLRRIAPHSGKIKVKLNLISTGSNTGCYLAYGSIDDLSMQETVIPVADVTIPIMNTASAILNGEEGDTLTSAANIGKGSVYPFYTAFYMTSTGNDVDRTIIIPVKKNVEYFVAVFGYSGLKTKNLRICYDEQAVN